MSNSLTIVPAGAGSGKTYRIETTLSDWLDKGEIRADRILAVTFTEAAASDMKSRIRARLLQSGRSEDALAIDRAYVGTIHGLGQRLLTEHAFAAGNAPTSRLLEETERDLLIRGQIGKAEALHPIAQNLSRFNYRFNQSGSAEDQFRRKVLSVIDLLRGLGPRGLEPSLLEELIATLTSDYGKTKDATALHAALQSAAKKMLDAFPSDVSEHVKAQGPKKKLREDHKLLKSAAQTDLLMSDWGAWQNLRTLFVSNRNSKTPEAYDAQAEAVMAAADGLEHHPGPLADAIEHITALVRGAQQILTAYDKEKRQRGLIDYADMIVRTEEILRESPETLKAVLGEIDCVVIDEFQDTNPVQFALLWRLAKHAPKALIVGDRKQAIMGFQGADPRLSAALDEQHADALDPLKNNWRSVPKIMEFVNAIGKGLFAEGYDALTPKAKAGEGPALTVLNLEGKLDHKFASIADYIQETLASKRVIRDAATKQPRAVKANDIAVLCYTKGHSQKMADALRALNIPVRVPENGWYDSLAVDMARSALAFAAHPADKFSALNLATRGPDRLDLALAFHGVHEGTIDAAETIEKLGSLPPSFKTLPVAQALEQVLSVSGLWEWAKRLPDAAQMVADLKRLCQEAHNFDSAPTGLREAAGFHGASIDVFIGWLADLAERGDDSHPDPSGWTAPGVEISTWHSSKGREWPVTIVAGWDKDIQDKPHTIRTEFKDFRDLDDVLSRANLSWHVPYHASERKQKQALKQQDSDEAAAARAIYVALTRARENLVLALPSAAKRAKERPANMLDLLCERTGFEQGSSEVKILGQSFSAQIKTYTKDIEFEEETPYLPEDMRSFGRVNPTRMDAPTPWRSSPSTRRKSATPAPKAEHTVYADALPTSDSLLNAADRGTACHLAFRVMFARPDAKARLLKASPLRVEDIDVIEQQAQSLRAKLTQQGYTQFHLELPLQQEDCSGAQINAIVDLLAESDDGFAIIDHKTGRYSDLQDGVETYWPQLAAYKDLIAEKWPDKPIKYVAINWMDEGKLSVASLPAIVSADAAPPV